MGRGRQKGQTKIMSKIKDPVLGFYELWLDKTMSYSSGFYLLPEDDLSRAQINKYTMIVINVPPKIAIEYVIKVSRVQHSFFTNTAM